MTRSTRLAGALWLFSLAGLLLLTPGQQRVVAAAASGLLRRGYTVLPEPQRVELKPGDLEFGEGWRLELREGVKTNDIAVEILSDELAKRYGVRLATAGRGKAIDLEIRPGSVQVGQSTDSNKAALAEQAYRLDLSPQRIRITANAGTGLLYGVETLVQLVKPEQGKWWLPEGSIVDWPDLENRIIYWDDNHHLDHLDALKDALRQALFYKINGFSIKLNGHFEYHSAPSVVEPYALSPAQLQELTDYGMRYHVQVIPYLDGPAHIAWILKHPEYAHLRAFPDSNYELCTENPDSYKLMDRMFADLLRANRGSKYFILSTDEPYYVGLARNAQCDEQDSAKDLGSVGKVLARYVTKTAGYLHDHGRKVIFWGEYPLKPDDVGSLPSYLINGEVYGPKFDPLFKARGIRQMIYASTEGEEYFFPNYYILPPSRLFNPTQMDDRMAKLFRDISFNPSRQQADLTGLIVAGWGDNGLHPETFWLGYATGTAWGWHPGSPNPQEAANSFYRLFYGQGATQMGRLYQLMSTQAEFWTSSWDWVPSTARKPIFGNSEIVFEPRRPAKDQMLPLPPVPEDAYLWLPYDWGQRNQKRVTLAKNIMAENDELLDLLHENLSSVEFHQYNLEVYLSIAGLYRQNLELLAEMEEINGDLKAAERAAGQVRFKDAVDHLDRALDTVEVIRNQRNMALENAKETWYQSWFPRVAEGNGRKYLNAIDDVKDHLPGRTVGMSYLVYREMLLPMDKWFAQVEAVRNEYSRIHGLPARTDKFDWKDTKTTHP
jgi:hexosaminidase